MKKNFLWCGAIAANQSEGSFQNRGIASADVIPIGDDRYDIIHGNKKSFHIDTKHIYPSHTAVDFYNHYKEDIKMIKELGMNAFRFSISWTRIFPHGNDEMPNEKGLQFYENIIKECLKNDIEPIIMINHYDVPLHLIKTLGGWKNREMIQHFLKLCKTVLLRYKGMVKYWIPINETDGILRYPFLIGGLVFDKNENIKQIQWSAIHHQLLANALCVKLAKETDENNIVGCMVGMSCVIPHSDHSDDIFSSYNKNRESYVFMDTLVRGHYPKYIYKHWKKENIEIPFKKKDIEILKYNQVDFIGFPYYYRNVINAQGYQRIEVDAKELRILLNQLYDRYEKPLFLCENAIGGKDILQNGIIQDDYRIEFIKEHIEQLRLAIEDGVEVIGYTFWNIIDSISVSKGEMDNRYGLIYVDRDNLGNGTYNRIAKNSYKWLKNYIKSEV